MMAGFRLRHTGIVRWLVGFAFIANVVLVGFVLLARAEAQVAAADDTVAAVEATAMDADAESTVPAAAMTPADSSAEALEAAGEQRLMEEIEKLAADLRQERQAVAARASEVPAAGSAVPDGGLAAADIAASPSAGNAGTEKLEDPFARLISAFENMEPETSAAALMPLYASDKNAALRVLLEISTRQAGAVMDALAGLSPETAAAIAHDVYARSVAARTAARAQNVPGAASGGAR